MGRFYAAMPFDYLNTLASLSDAQFGRLMRWLLNYAATGEVGELKGKEKLFQAMVQVQEDRFRESYEQAAALRVDKARKAANVRWEKKGSPMWGHPPAGGRASEQPPQAALSES